MNPSKNLANKITEGETGLIDIKQRVKHAAYAFKMKAP